MRRNVSIAALVLLAVMLTACSTGDWKSFKNDTYGYSFEVPSSCFEGPLAAGCKQNPPEERPEECLCIVNGTDPDFVTFQRITMENGKAIMASISIMSPDTEAYSPEGTDLVPFVQQEFGEFYSTDIPDESNMELDGQPALRVQVTGGQGVGDYEDIFFILGDRLFKITTLDITEEINATLYDHMLSSFKFND